MIVSDTDLTVKDKKQDEELGAAEEIEGGAPETRAEEPVEPVADKEPDPTIFKWAESTGAFVLGVLNEEDSREAAAEYAKSTTLQSELASLLPVADILTSLYQPSAAAVSTSESTSALPERDRRPTSQPKTRRSGESNRATPRLDRSSPKSISVPTLQGLPIRNLIMAALGILAAGSVLWALALSDRLNTKDDDIAALNRQIAELRSGSNASAFVLFPTADGGTANGTVFHSLSNSSVLLDVSGLPELPEDRVFQIWLQRSGESTWEQGPTFVVNSQGESVQRLSGDIPTFTQIAISVEPVPGSSEPTGPFLLTGALAVANG